jgi:hypothetical protein
MIRFEYCKSHAKGEPPGMVAFHRKSYEDRLTPGVIGRSRTMNCDHWVPIEFYGKRMEPGCGRLPRRNALTISFILFLHEPTFGRYYWVYCGNFLTEEHTRFPLGPGAFKRKWAFKGADRKSANAGIIPVVYQS